MADWSKLPGDLVCVVAEKLKILEDYSRMSSVCAPWRRAMQEKSQSCYRQQIPWLMLPYCEKDDHDQGEGVFPNFCNRSYCRGFFSISENKVHHLELPEAYGKRCCGSSFGWLVMVEESPAIFLLNPITRCRIELPSMTTFPDILGFREEEVGDEYLCKDVWDEKITYPAKHIKRIYMMNVILTAEPTMKSCIVMAICGELRVLAFCRPGDEQWCIIKPDKPNAYHDVIYWRNQFYAIDGWGGLVVCDTRDSSPTITKILENPVGVRICLKRYLVVDSSGELMMVSRWIYEGNGDGYGNETDSEEGDDNDEYDDYDDDDDEYDDDDNDEEHDDDDDDDDDDEHALDSEDNNNNGSRLNHFYKTSRFQVFKLDEEKKNWRKVDSLGDYMIFLGANRASYLLASDFPKCKPNCIYFTDDYLNAHQEGNHGGYDLGIFNLEDGSIQPFPCCRDESTLIWPPPIWVTPSPC